MIAEAQGFRNVCPVSANSGDLWADNPSFPIHRLHPIPVPKYLEDLDAIRNAVIDLLTTEEQQTNFLNTLATICVRERQLWADKNPKLHAEALIKTLGKWANP